MLVLIIGQLVFVWLIPFLKALAVFSAGAASFKQMIPRINIMGGKKAPAASEFDKVQYLFFFVHADTHLHADGLSRILLTLVSRC